MPAFCDLLDLSERHLPPGLADHLSSVPGVDAHAACGGWLLTVPTDANAGNPHPVARESLDVIWRYARDLGCDLVLFTADADAIDTLPTW